MADLTTKQVAEVLECDTDQVRRYIRLGFLHARRQPNGRFTVAEEEVRRLKNEVAAKFF